MSATADSRTPRGAQRLLVLSFLVCLGAPWIDALVRPASARGPEVEGRRAQTFPHWTPGALFRNGFREQFEQALADSLGLRDVLLRWNNRLLLDLLHSAPSRVILCGKDGWLFYTGESSVEVWRGLDPLAPVELAAWQHAIEVRRDRARLAGADYFLVIGPNKESIYPDYLPQGYEALGPSRFEQFAAWMQAHSDVSLIDLRPCLRAARAEDTPRHHLYYEEGTHWYGRGTLAATGEIVRRVGERFPAVAALPALHWLMDSFSSPESWRTKLYLKPLPGHVRDEWRTEGQTGRTRRLGNDPAAPIQHFAQLAPAPGLPSALLFHDSFGQGVYRLLAESFSRFTTELTIGFDDELLATEHPAIVIDLYVERILANPNPNILLPPPPPTRAR